MNNTIEGKVEVGGTILSYCGKCKADSLHVIFAMESSKISKVTCEGCGAKHNYRKPKSLIKSKKTTKTSKGTKSTVSQRVKKSNKKGEDLFANCDTSVAQDYNIKKSYNESSVIRHPSFGIGIVTKKIGQEKIEVQFEDGAVKLLIINRTIEISRFQAPPKKESAL